MHGTAYVSVAAVIMNKSRFVCGQSLVRTIEVVCFWCTDFLDNIKKALLGLVEHLNCNSYCIHVQDLFICVHLSHHTFVNTNEET